MTELGGETPSRPSGSRWPAQPGVLLSPLLEPFVLCAGELVGPLPRISLGRPHPQRLAVDAQILRDLHDRLLLPPAKIVADMEDVTRSGPPHRLVPVYAS